eukprot:2926515-Amphidinium_carterae.1
MFELLGFSEDREVPVFTNLACAQPITMHRRPCGGMLVASDISHALNVASVRSMELDNMLRDGPSDPLHKTSSIVLPMKSQMQCEGVSRTKNDCARVSSLVQCMPTSCPSLCLELVLALHMWSSQAARQPGSCQQEGSNPKGNLGTDSRDCRRRDVAHPVQIGPVSRCGRLSMHQQEPRVHGRKLEFHSSEPSHRRLSLQLAPPTSPQHRNE